MTEKINIRGVNIDNVNLQEAAEICQKYINSNEFHTVFTPNSEIIQLCIEKPEYLPLFNSADLVTPDGIGVVYASKILGKPLKCKTAGYDLGLEVVKMSNEKGYKIYFLGGKPGVAEAARDKLLEKYPNAVFVGCHDGYFDKGNSSKNTEVLRQINESASDVLFVCFGVPAQEKWISENREKLSSVKLCLALGGSLDGYSGNVKRAPKIFIDLGLEWFYRLCKEPKRIGRMMKLPKFLIGTLIYKFKGSKQ